MPAAHTGFLLALIGSLLNITGGWQSEAWQPMVGEARALGPDDLLVVRVESFELLSEASGAVASAVTRISWHSGESNLAQSSVTRGRPAKVRGVAVRQLGYMPALSIRGWDEEGHPLLLGEETGPGLPSGAEVLFPDPAARPILFLETLDRLLVLSYEPARRGGRPAVHFALTASAGEERVPIGVLYESGTVTIEGARLQVDMTFRPILQADRLPGAALSMAGAVLALVALAVAWLARPEFAWIAAVPGDEVSTHVQVAFAPSDAGRRMALLLEEADQIDRRRRTARLQEALRGVTRAWFLLLGAAITACAIWAHRATGSLSCPALPAGWSTAGLLLAAMSLLAWRLRAHAATWAAILAALSGAAFLVGLVA